VKVRIYAPRFSVFQNLPIGELQRAEPPLRVGDRAYHIDTEAFEHIGSGVVIRPQTSADLELNGPAACVVAGGAVPRRETAGPFIPFRRVV
jgi:hypothetical protein